MMNKTKNTNGECPNDYNGCGEMYIGACLTIAWPWNSNAYACEWTVGSVNSYI